MIYISNLFCFSFFGFVESSYIYLILFILLIADMSLKVA